MDISEFAKQYQAKMFGGENCPLAETDPEFVERFSNFAFDEVVNSDDLDGKTRFLAILATLLGCQGIDEFRVMLPAALNFGVTPAEAKEVVYQAVAYLGIGRVMPFLNAANEIFRARGVKLPLEGQARTTTENHLQAGEQAQIDIFGEGMRGFAETGKDTNGQVNKWLVDNCFGDYYTRGGLDYKQREMITFCFLAAQGGCEPQLTSHAAANMRVGNGRAVPAVHRLPAQPQRAPLRERRGESAGKIKEHGIKEDSMDYKDFEKSNVFGKGQENTAFAQYFIGNSYLNPLTKPGDGLAFANVTFEPGCRNNWHIHHAKSGGGQILLCVAGSGWYQEWGKEARSLNPGDVVVISAGVKHWHGAKKDSWFSHIAVEAPGEDTKNEWLESVSDEQYNSLQ